MISSELQKVLDGHQQHLKSSLEGFQVQHEEMLQRQEELVMQLLERCDYARSPGSPGSPYDPMSPMSEVTLTSMGPTSSRTPPSPTKSRGSPVGRTASMASLASMGGDANLVVGKRGSVLSLGTGGQQPPSGEETGEEPVSGGVENRRASYGLDWAAHQLSMPAMENEECAYEKPRRPIGRGAKGRKGRQSRRRKVAVTKEADVFEPAQRAILGLAEKPAIKKMVAERVGQWHLPERWKRVLARTDGPFSKLVKRPSFFAVTNLLILSNVIFIAVEAQHRVHQARDGSPPMADFELADTIFTVAFSVELALRLIAERAAFFLAPDWRWNVMDLLFVSTDLMNEVLTIIAQQGGGGFVSTAATIQSSARTLRLVRAARAFRALRLLAQLPRVKQMVQELVRSLVPVVWMLTLLAVLLLFFSLIFMQAAADGLQSGVGEAASRELWSRFDSLEQASLSLFKVFTGGLEWEPLHASLAEVSTFYGIGFVMFIIVVVLAFLNIVSATFVASALTTKMIKDTEDAQAACAEVKRLIHDFGITQESGMVNLEDLLDLLDVPSVKYYLASVNLDGSSVRAIFDLLDAEGHKSVRVADLAQGCAKFARAVRGSDFVSVLLASRLLSTQLQGLSALVDLRTASLEEVL